MHLEVQNIGIQMIYILLYGYPLTKTYSNLKILLKLNYVSFSSLFSFPLGKIASSNSSHARLSFIERNILVMLQTLLNSTLEINIWVRLRKLANMWDETFGAENFLKFCFNWTQCLFFITIFLRYVFLHTIYVQLKKTFF